MKFTFDPDKDAANRAKHGLGLSEADRLHWRDAVFVADRRRDYREDRIQIFGDIDGRLHVLIVTPREGGMRAISLRKANKREIRTYGRSHVQP